MPWPRTINVSQKPVDEVIATYEEEEVGESPTDVDWYRNLNAVL